MRRRVSTSGAFHAPLVRFHTSAQAFGKVMSMVEPRRAVAYHFINEEGTRYGIYEAIRETCDGPWSMAADLMVWNVTKDEIVERMVVATHEAWSAPGTAKQPPRDPSLPHVMTDCIQTGRINVDDATVTMIKESSETNGWSLNESSLRRQGP